MFTPTLQAIALGEELRPLRAILAVLTSSWASCGYATEPSAARSQPYAVEPSITMTIVYDNNPSKKGLTTGWGFACLIQGLDKTILFDTGGDGPILLQNMRSLDLDPKKIDAVVLSHIHGDHTDGLASVLALRTGVPVYMPTGFPSAFKEQVRALGATPQEGKTPQEVCPGARTTGTLGQGAIEEQGLCVKTNQGWVLVTGCAHPGVAHMAARAKESAGGPLRMVVGGFHMRSQPESSINAIIDRLEELGVQGVAPCHCTGDTARQLFKRRFGPRCELVGVGSVLRFPEGVRSDKAGLTGHDASRDQ